jgi:ferric-dicitrate binding protein FerR (iron transport regulator)
MNQELEEEFEAYLIDYEEGSISSSDMNKMRELMSQHEPLRKIFVQQQMLHASCSKVKLKDLAIADLERAKVEPRKQIVPFVVNVTSMAALLAIAIVASFFVYQSTQGPLPALATNMSEHRQYKIIRHGVEVEASEFLPGDKVRSYDKELSIAYLDDETLILLKANSEIELKQENGAKRIFLHSGSLICDVDKQPENKPMVITTHHAKTTVLGTQFMLHAEASETQLQVNEGAVDFKDTKTQKQVRAKAGFVAKTTPGQGVEMGPYEYDTQVRIQDFILVDPISETPHLPDTPLYDGMVIPSNQMKSDYLNILMQSDDQVVDGVMFTFEIINQAGKKLKCINEKGQKKNKAQETIFPYYVVGDGLEGREDKPCKWKWIPGEYRLSATPYGKKNKHIGQTREIRFWIK